MTVAFCHYHLSLAIQGLAVLYRRLSTYPPAPLPDQAWERGCGLQANSMLTLSDG